MKDKNNSVARSSGELGAEVLRRIKKLQLSSCLGIIMAVASLVIVLVGVPYFVTFRIENERWPWQHRVEITCESTSEKDTYEVPYYNGETNTSIPIRIKWVVGKPLRLKATPDPYHPSLQQSVINIDNENQYEGSQLLSLPLNVVAGKLLNLDATPIGERKSFEVLVEANGFQQRKKVNIIRTPWSHKTELSEPLIQAGNSTTCTVMIENRGDRK